MNESEACGGLVHDINIEPGVTIMYGPLMQLASALWCACAFYPDALFVRTCLWVAYGLLLVNAFRHSVNVNALAMDGILWSLVPGAVHCMAAYTLVREEVRRAPALPTDEDRALWAYLHRRTGMVMLDFQRLHSVGRWVRFAPDDVICDTAVSRGSLFILLEGRLQAKFRNDEQRNCRTKELRSGDCFDYRVLNVLGVFVGAPNEHFECVARSTGLLFELPLQDVVALTRRVPEMQAFLRTCVRAVPRPLPLAWPPAPGAVTQCLRAERHLLGG